MSFAVATIVARNYLPFARVVAASTRVHHPEAEIHVLVLDGPASAEEPFRVYSPDDLGLGTREFHAMAAIYSLTELATASKPSFLSLLTQASDEPVLFLDPDIWVLAPIDTVVDRVRSSGLVVTPHLTTPMPRDGLAPTEYDILIAGTFNLGFLGVDRRAEPFLRWWHERLRRDCLVDVGRGLMVDQRWVDLASQIFEFDVVRDPGFNLAYWNLHDRRLGRDGDGYTIDDGPLRAFHFSGFDPMTPGRLTRHHPVRPRHRPIADPVLRDLCESYAERLVKSGAPDRTPYAFAASADGVVLTPTLRLRYRAALLTAEITGSAWPVDPFAADSAFRTWVRPRPSPRWRSRPVGSRQGPARDNSAPVVDVVGYLSAEDGIGAVARGHAAALEAAGADVRRTVLTDTPNRQEHPVVGATGGVQVPDARLVYVNADRLGLAASSALGRSLITPVPTAGIWAWEVSEFPDEMSRAVAHVHEVWTYSHHAAAVIRERVPVPVRVVPPAMVLDDVGVHRRSDRFTFLFCFDFNSVFERKNPLAIVDAYTRAFEPDHGAVLVLKSVNGERHPQASARLRRAVAGRRDVVLEDGYLAPADQRALIAGCDVYVSLHRAEGYGLTMVEAMACGRPVIATAYSGNVDYMTSENSLLVPYELVPVPVGCDPYPTTAHWAEPSIDVAAEMMRSLWADPTLAAKIGERARDDIVRTHSVEHRGPQLLEEVIGLADRYAGSADQLEVPPSKRGPLRLARRAGRAVLRRALDRDGLVTAVHDLQRELRAQQVEMESLAWERTELANRLDRLGESGAPIDGRGEGDSPSFGRGRAAEGGSAEKG